MQKESLDSVSAAAIFDMPSIIRHVTLIAEIVILRNCAGSKLILLNGESAIMRYSVIRRKKELNGFISSKS
jgi:hypothetical protein